MDEGSALELGPGDVFVCAPGHDAWVLGSEPCVVLDFAGGAEVYARKSAAEAKRASEAEAAHA